MRNDCADVSIGTVAEQPRFFSSWAAKVRLSRFVSPDICVYVIPARASGLLSSGDEHLTPTDCPTRRQ